MRWHYKITLLTSKQLPINNTNIGKEDHMKKISGCFFSKDGSFHNGTITIENGLIAQIDYHELDSTDIESDEYILPGLVDIHLHGCAGHDFCEGTETAFDAIEQYEMAHGVTSICATTMTLPSDTICNICKGICRHKGKSIFGIHLEGPFLSEGKKGAQNGAYLQKPNVELLKSFQEAASGMIKLVAIAPEEEGAMECIREYGNQVQFSIAHTSADYEIAKKAMKAGATHVTHLYNAMPPFSHRSPGVIGAAADMEETHVELICDGIHVHPSVVRSTFKLFGKDRIILVSDSMMATGMEDGIYSLGGQVVNVKGNLATLEDGTIAGSVTNLFDCMVNTIQMGIPKEDAILAATINPARSLGMETQIGSIEVGKKADLLIVDKDFHLKMVIKDGIALS